MVRDFLSSSRIDVKFRTTFSNFADLLYVFFEKMRLVNLIWDNR